MRPLFKVHGKALMEEMPSAVAMTLSLGNSACDNSGFATQVEIARTDTASLLLDPPAVLPVEFVSGEDLNSSNPPEIETGRHGNRNGLTASDAINQECEDDEILSAVDDRNNCDDDLLNLDTNPSLGLPGPVVIQDTGTSQIVAKIVNFDIPNVGLQTTGVLGQTTNGSDVKVPAAVSREKNQAGSTRSIFEVECLPLWGSVCICGRRPEMEDAVAAVPSAINIPLKMLIGDHEAINRMSQSISHLTGHFFGVYDGHGGSQVASYLQNQIHLALAEEIETINNDLTDERMKSNGQVQWETVFTRCFVKVDDKVGGKVKRGFNVCDTDISNQNSEPLAPETVGSTAVVALMCSSHLIVANCGDSRAVLFHGKEAVPLSTDHKPSREDEYARIEAAGGKVIQWNGYRVFGVLAMSRSIGDRYLKPWIIPDPEVTIVPRSREDECLILASDGLWDVMTNEEVCEVARRRILLWHKKNGTAPPSERGKDVDPASQAAAEYLSALALQKGSKDNISVIVVDLKAHRKFKNRGR